MDITKLAAKPTLIKISLDDEDIVKEFGEPIDFYTHDRTPLHTFLRLSRTMETNQEESLEILKTLILDKDGNKVITDGVELPIKIMVKTMAKVMDTLGK